MCLITNFPLLLALLLHAGQTGALDLLPCLGDRKEQLKVGKDLQRSPMQHQSGQLCLQEVTQGLLQPAFAVSKHENFTVFPRKSVKNFDHTSGNHFSFYLIRIFHVLACSCCLFIHRSTALRRESALSPLHPPWGNIFHFMTSWRCLPWALAASPGITAWDRCFLAAWFLCLHRNSFGLQRRISDCPLEKCTSEKQCRTLC